MYLICYLGTKGDIIVAQMVLSVAEIKLFLEANAAKTDYFVLTAVRYNEAV